MIMIVNNENDNTIAAIVNNAAVTIRGRRFGTRLEHEAGSEQDLVSLNLTGIAPALRHVSFVSLLEGRYTRINNL